MAEGRGIIPGWEGFSDDEAIDAAIETYGYDATTSVAYCALQTYGNRNDPEYRFWFDLFFKLTKEAHIGWA